MKEDKGGPSTTAGRAGAGTPAASRPGEYPAVGGEGSGRGELESSHEHSESIPARQTDAFEVE